MPVPVAVPAVLGRRSAPARRTRRRSRRTSSSSRMSLTSDDAQGGLERLAVARARPARGRSASRRATSEVEIRTCRMRSSRTKRWMLASMSGASSRSVRLRAPALAEARAERAGALAGAHRALFGRSASPAAGLRLVLAARRAVDARRGGPPGPSPRGPPGRRGRRPRRRRRGRGVAGGRARRVPVVVRRGRARGHGRGRGASATSAFGSTSLGSAPSAFVTSLSYLTTTDTVSERTCEFSSSMPSTASVRAQSMVSEMLGALRSSSSRSPRTTSTSSLGQRLGQPGVLRPDDLQLALRGGVVEEQVQAAALEGGGQVAGVVAGQDDVRGRASAMNVPISGTETWNSPSVSSSTASSASSARSTSSISRTTGSVGADRLQQRARGEEAARRRTRCPASPIRSTADGEVGGVGDDLADLLAQHLGVEQLLAVVPLVEGLGLVLALVALQPQEPPAGGQRRASWRARSCRRRRGPRAAAASPAGSAGTPWWPGGGRRCSRARRARRRPRRRSRRGTRSGRSGCSRSAPLVSETGSAPSSQCARRHAGARQG